MSFTADLIEQAALSIFQELGWHYEAPADIAPDGPDKRRASSSEVVLSGLLQLAARVTYVTCLAARPVPHGHSDSIRASFNNTESGT